MKFKNLPPVVLNQPFTLWTPDQCEDFINRAKTSLIRGTTYNEQHYPDNRKNYVGWVELTPDEKDYCWEIVHPFWGEITWFEHPIQVSRYQPGEYFGWHRDGKPNQKRSSIRYLTLTCTLQTAPDAYLELKNRKYELDTGEAVIFYSDYDHRATSPSQGERWSFTIWYMKPNNK